MDALQPYLPLIINALRVLAIIGLIHAIVTRQQVYWIVMLAFGALFGGLFGLAFAAVYTFMVLLPAARGRPGGRAGSGARRGGPEASGPAHPRGAGRTG
ncbi:hypothetical protein [Deinococcus multiflagellatus]|uniref:Uncharacterized protein n=1 Tax=Deinococcus multiflagellatus TaxID=1656887 RepID=A0ABW1ZIN5_9DEIO